MPASDATISGMSASELAVIYSRRFQGDLAYRDAVWKVLTSQFFQRFVKPSDTVLDLGAGYGQFINNIRCGRKLAMDLNADSAEHLAPDVTLLAQDCSEPWGIESNSLDVVFTSNFFEHLPDKQALTRTLEQALRCLKPGGRLIAMGPNIKFTGGAYWDFWDHYLPLTELSLKEGLETIGFRCSLVEPRFLPYTMVGGPQYPPFMIATYLRFPLAWRFFGKQFLVVAERL